MQEELIEMLKNNLEDPTDVYESEDMDGDLSDEDFERIALEDAANIKSGKMNNEAEEESNWDEI